MAKSVQSEEVTCPSCELMRGRSRRFVDEDHASGEKVLKITFHGWTTEIRVALVGIIEDDDHVHASLDEVQNRLDDLVDVHRRRLDAVGIGFWILGRIWYISLKRAPSICCRSMIRSSCSSSVPPLGSRHVVHAPCFDLQPQTDAGRMCPVCPPTLRGGSRRSPGPPPP